MQDNQSGSSAGRCNPNIPPPQGEAKARADRSRAGHKGGEISAHGQRRDSFGQFAGRTERRTSARTALGAIGRPTPNIDPGAPL